MVDIVTRETILEKFTLSLVSCLQSCPNLPHLSFHIIARMVFLSHQLQDKYLGMYHKVLPMLASALLSSLFPQPLQLSIVPHALSVLNY